MEAGIRIVCHGCEFMTPVFRPVATDGWYVVFLFAADGSAVFLSLNQGTTKFVKGSSVPLDPELLQARVNDARAKLNSGTISVAGLLQSIDLKDPGNKGGGYERGNAYATKYDADKIPQDSTILADSSRLLDLLKVLYRSAATNETSRASLPSSLESRELGLEQLAPDGDAVPFR